MKRRTWLCLAAAFLLFSACAAQSGGPELPPGPPGGVSAPGEEPPPAAAPEDAPPVEKTEEERLLDGFAERFEDWRDAEERDWWGYAVADLDQDGNWELIVSNCRGTGHFMSTSLYRPDGNGEPRLVSVGNSVGEPILEELARYGPRPAAPLLMPRLEHTGEVQRYPVYYDGGQGTYTYVYEDLVKGILPGDFATLRAFSPGEEPQGVILGYCLTAFHREEQYTSREYWDMSGNYISRDAYDGLVDQYVSGLEEMEARILWIECLHDGDVDGDGLRELLRQSMDAFSIGPASR